MENQKTITIKTNDLRDLLTDARYAVELAKDLAEEIGEDDTTSGSVGYRAGQIFSILDNVYEKLDDAIVNHVLYVDEELENN
jgi:hypothetical protein